MQAKPAASLVLAALLVAAPTPASARAGDLSWGRPGVTLEAYSADSTDCVNKAVNLDISDTAAVRRLVAATRALQNLESGWAMWGYTAGGASSHAQLREAYRPDRQFEAIKTLQQATLDTCLIERGYRQFRLTEEQQARLRQLEEGSPERRAFLHGLAADPEVLRRQGLDHSPLQPAQG